MVPTSRPNILLIMVDQLASRVLSSEGGPVPARGIEELCETGVVFEQAITPFPVCSPARASIVTGLHPHTHGIVHNVMSQDYPMVAVGPHDRGISARDQTTEGLLHARGYQTHHRGKWHLSDESLAYYPVWYRETQEYAVEMRPAFAAAANAPQTMNWYGWTLPVDIAPAVVERFPGDAPGTVADQAAGTGSPEEGSRRFDEFIGKMGRLLWPEELTYDHLVTTEAIRCIEQATNDGRPFMVTCSLNNPHDPNVAPDPYYTMFDPDEIVLPPSYPTCETRHQDSLSWHLASRLGEAGVREYLRVYYAQTALIDAQVERLLATLDRCGVAENTLVIFIGDHGDMAGSHGMIWKSTEAFYDELVRVPLIMRWPGHLTPHRDARCVSSVDIMPTLLEAATVAAETPIQGHSLLVTDRTARQAFSVSQRFVGHDATTRHVSEDDPVSIMIRTPTQKLVRYHDGAEEYFDLDQDPHETTNLARHPGMQDERRSLLHRLVGWMQETSHPQWARFQDFVISDTCVHDDE